MPEAVLHEARVAKAAVWKLQDMRGILKMQGPQENRGDIGTVTKGKMESLDLFSTCVPTAPKAFSSLGARLSSRFSHIRAQRMRKE